MDYSEYTIVAEARGQQPLWFRRFGSYQGEWLLLAVDENLYYVYKDYYGSCTGCDALQADSPGPETVQEFIKAYPSFLEMRKAAALDIAQREGNLLAVLPKNVNMNFEGMSAEHVGRQLALVVKHDQGEIDAEEILEFDNMELRREGIEKFGAERWVEQIGAEVVNIEGDNSLMRLDRHDEPFCFLYLKDGSTPRRYVLRVAPEHETVNAARAASFGIEPSRFHLSVET